MMAESSGSSDSMASGFIIYGVESSYCASSSFISCINTSSWARLTSLNSKKVEPTWAV